MSEPSRRTGQTLEEALTDLRGKLDQLPCDSAERAEQAQRVAHLETEIADRRRGSAFV